MGASECEFFFFEKNTVPCAVQEILVVYLFYIQQCLTLKFLIDPLPTPFTFW